MRYTASAAGVRVVCVCVSLSAREFDPRLLPQRTLAHAGAEEEVVAGVALARVLAHLHVRLGHIPARAAVESKVSAIDSSSVDSPGVQWKRRSSSAQQRPLDSQKSKNAVVASAKLPQKWQ